MKITKVNKISKLKLLSNGKAFTLMEVLIIMGIIGIIIELTIPSLITKVEKLVKQTKIKQTYSDLSNAIILSEVDNGLLSYWNYPKTASIDISRAFYDTYFKPYLKNAKFCGEGFKSNCGLPVSGAGVNYMLNNGVGFSMVVNSDGGGKVYMLLDLNNAKPPGVMGKDVFYYTMSPTTGLIPYGYVKEMSRVDVINDPSFGCKSSGVVHPRYLCAVLIMIDGWQIKDDYPW